MKWSIQKTMFNWRKLNLLIWIVAYGHVLEAKAFQDGRKQTGGGKNVKCSPAIELYLQRTGTRPHMAGVEGAIDTGQFKFKFSCDFNFLSSLLQIWNVFLNICKFFFSGMTIHFVTCKHVWVRISSNIGTSLCLQDQQLGKLHCHWWKVKITMSDPGME